jgi:hypothetical protein
MLLDAGNQRKIAFRRRPDQYGINRALQINIVTRIVVVAAIAASLLGAGSVQRKFEAIESGSLRPGSSVVFTPGEINAWAKTQAPSDLRGIQIAFETGRVTASAQVDFKVGGAHPVTVTARLESRNGEARVDVERVEISGVPIEGPALDLLIRTFLMPRFPDARVDEWFRLDWRIDRIAVSPLGVAVYIGRN